MKISDIARRRIQLPLIMVVVASLGATSLANQAAAAASPLTGGLHLIRCTRLTTDTPVAAPLYAQEEGASGETDGWWCEIPHATEVPAKFIELKHLDATLSTPYGLFSTYYGYTRSNTQPVVGPGIVVSDDMDSSPRPPKHLRYPPLPHGTKVHLRKGVTAIVTTVKATTTVTWRFPTSGVPRYLRAIVTVTVAGVGGVPKSVVLAVARHVTPS
jgi:hypothetical protein